MPEIILSSGMIEEMEKLPPNARFNVFDSEFNDFNWKHNEFNLFF